MTGKVDYSVVMIVDANDVDFCPHLLSIHNALQNFGARHELILALNGPNDSVQDSIARWPEDGPTLTVIELTRQVYSGTCLQSLLKECRGQVLVVCGSYQQVTENVLRRLIEIVTEGDADIALPWRRNRIDPLINQLQSRFFNYLVFRMTGVKVHDLSTRLRVIRRNVLEETLFNGDLYRFLPVLAKKRGFKVIEIPADHVEEKGKEGYFGLRVYASRLIDLITIRFNLNFARKPLRYFGLRGGVLAISGILAICGAVLFRVTGFDSLGNSPVLLIGLLLFLTGSGLWGIGLLGEILVFALGRHRKDYIVEKIIP